MSPVDCIIEGFDVATDLSQIDVCRTMVYSPTPKLLELEAAGREDTTASPLDSTNVTTPYPNEVPVENSLEEFAKESDRVPTEEPSPSVGVKPPTPMEEEGPSASEAG